MKTHRVTARLLLSVALLGVAAALFAAAAVGPADETKKPDPPKLDRIKVDVRTKQITVEGRFCLEEGILDYLGVAAGGKEYESVTSLNCAGSRLHAGLLAIGAVPGPTPQMLALLRKAPPKDRPLPKRPGTSLEITAVWTVDGKEVSVPATRLLFNRRTRKAQNAGGWTFTGSYFAKDAEGKEFYMADIDRTLIAVVYDGGAVIGFDHDAGNPYSGPDEGYEVNKDLVPKRDTPLKIVITLAKKKD